MINFIKQLSIVLFLISTLYYFGCEDSNTLSTPKHQELHTTYKPSYYTDYIYFLDDVYSDTSSQLNLFYKKFNGIQEIEDDSTRYYYVKNIQVWIGTDYTNSDYNSIEANCYFNINSRLPHEYYPDSMREPIISDDWKKYSGNNFYLLSEGVDYYLEPSTGFIILHRQIMKDDIIACAYRIRGPNIYDSDNDDIVFGEFLEEFVTQNAVEKILLKLIKPQFLQPSQKEAWSLKVKNIYTIERTSNIMLKSESDKIEIQYLSANSKYVNMYEGSNLVTLFGFDNYTKSGDLESDGVFDFYENILYDPVYTPYLVFPKLKPFGSDLPNCFDSSFQFNNLYSKSKFEIIDDEKDIFFKIFIVQEVY